MTNLSDQVALVTGASRGVALCLALASDPEVARRSGSVLVAAALAAEYGFTDIDGRQPRPLTVADV